MSFSAPRTQKIRRLRRIGSLFFALLFCVVFLSACGKRPSQVDPPPGGAQESRVYPKPETTDLSP